MIEKISQINNFGVFKEFKWNYTLKDYPFKELNIIYGRNYSGKTTMSRMMRSFEIGYLSDKYGSPEFKINTNDKGVKTEKNYKTKDLLIRVFNEDFVRENFQFFTNSENSSITPFAILGDNNTRLQSEIDVIRKELGLSELGNETGLHKILVDAEKEYKDASNALENAKNQLNRQKSNKATSKDGIKYHSDLYGDQNYTIRKLEDDIIKVCKPDYVQITDKQIEMLKASLKEEVILFDGQYSKLIFDEKKWIEKVNQLCSTKIGTSAKIQELLLDTVLNDWVHQGLELNKERKKCAFCGQPLTSDRWEELYNHFDKELEKLKANILNVKNALEKIENEVINYQFDVNRVYKSFYPNVEKINDELEKEKIKIIESIKNLKKSLEKKKEHITEVFFVENVDSNIRVDELNSIYEKILQDSRRYGEKLTETKNSNRGLLRLAEVFNFIKTIDYNGQNDTIESLLKEKNKNEENLNKIKEEIEFRENEIKDKYKKMRDEKKGAEKVNQYLNDYFGHKYLSIRPQEIENEGNQIVNFEIVRNGSVAYNMSEGEKSLIAFCYFIAKLDDVETQGKNPIIWIDDPISSLDGNHIYFVYSLISSAILYRAEYEQLFITTHNLEFLKYINRMGASKNQKNKKIGTASFMIERNGAFSTIKKMPKYLKEHGSEFQYWFTKIYDCAQQNELNDENMYLFESFGNSARKFFETYLYYKYPDDNNLDDHMKRFFKDDSISKFLLDKFGDENSHASGDLEMRCLPYDAPEVIDIARKILNALQSNDPEQYQILSTNANI